MKVALIAPVKFSVPFERYSEIENYIYNLATELSKKIDVTLIAAIGSKNPEKCKLIQTVTPRGLVEDEHVAYEKYKDKLDEFDLVHDFTYLKHVYLADAINNGVRVLSTVYFPITWKSLPPLARPNIVTITRRLGDFIYSRYGYKPKIIPIGIYHSDISSSSDESRDYIVSFGPMLRESGHHSAIWLSRKAREKLIIMGEDRIVADTRYVEYIKQLSNKSENITYMGWSPFHERITIFSRAKAMLVLGVPHITTLFAILEALSCGTPIISLRSAGVDEFIVNGISGFICDGLEGENSVLEALHKIDILRPNECRRIVYEQFSIRSVTEKYLGVYYSLMKGDSW